MVGASPQTGNGHTRFANELLDAIYRFPFSAAQLRVVLWIGRNSYGWSRKKTEARSLNNISKDTGMPRSTIDSAIGTLIKAGVIVKEGDAGQPGRYALHKDYTTWVPQDTDLLPLVSGGSDSAKVSDPSDSPSDPSDRSVRPVGQSAHCYKVLKEKKERIKTRGTFVPPALEEVVAYCAERKALGMPSIDPEQFYHHYEANGWRQGGRGQIKNWRSCVITWEKRAGEFGGVRRGGAKPVAGAAPQPGKYGSRA